MKVRLNNDLVLHDRVMAKKGDVIEVLDDGPPNHVDWMLDGVKWRLFPYEFTVILDGVNRDAVMAELQEMRDRLGIIIRKVEALENPKGETDEEI